jgi:DNA-binding NtrC family response regulator
MCSNSRLLAKVIAVIEDEIDVLYLYQEVLENEGYTVFAYNDPIEAINTIQQMPEEFGLVISDYRMPLINGFEVCTKLIELNPELKVVIISAFDLLEEDRNPKFTFINKPITIAKLISVVNEAVSKSISFNYR